MWVHKRTFDGELLLDLAQILVVVFLLQPECPRETYILVVLRILSVEVLGDRAPGHALKRIHREWSVGLNRV